MRAGAGHISSARAQRRELVPDAAVVDDDEAVGPCNVVVVLLDREVVERLGLVEVTAHGVDRAQCASEIDQLLEIGEPCFPSVEPNAAHDACAVISVIEAEPLLLEMGNTGTLFDESGAKFGRQHIAIVLSRLRRAAKDPLALAAVGHIPGHGRKECGVRDLEHRPAVVDERPPAIYATARLTMSHGAVHAKER